MYNITSIVDNCNFLATTSNMNYGIGNTELVDITAHGNDRGDGFKYGEYHFIADITSVKYIIDAFKMF